MWPVTEAFSFGWVVSLAVFLWGLEKELMGLWDLDGGFLCGSVGVVYFCEAVLWGFLDIFKAKFLVCEKYLFGFDFLVLLKDRLFFELKWLLFHLMFSEIGFELEFKFVDVFFPENELFFPFNQVGFSLADGGLALG